MKIIIGHIVLAIVLIYVGIAIFYGAYKNLKKKCRHTDSQDGTPELSNRQKQLNDAFEKMLENEKCNK
ncbi:MAG: hypothetical protein KBT27_01530 [Prevotellaceae bacterium]|nr:hypothetical protein [Candidatus Faecinaster equi]